MKAIPSTQAGFSLLEMIIAFSILAVSLGILLKIFSSGLINAQIAEDYTIATQIANNLMAKVGTEIPLKTNEVVGEENEFYHWRVRVNPQTGTSSELDFHDLPVELFSINVVVWWGDDKRSDDRILELNTLKIASLPPSS